MPFDRFEWLRRLKAVEREYLAARLAIDWLSEHARTDPSLLQGDVRQRDLVRASALLEGTYIVRLFAEFESGLRNFWPTIKASAAPRIRDLIQRVGSACKVGYDDLNHAQGVREYRNVLVHERHQQIANISIAIARSHLCKFLGRLR